MVKGPFVDPEPGYRQDLQIASRIATGTLLFSRFEATTFPIITRCISDAAIWHGALSGTHAIWGPEEDPTSTCGGVRTLFSKPRQRFQWPAKLRGWLAPNRLAQLPTWYASIGDRLTERGR